MKLPNLNIGIVSCLLVLAAGGCSQSSTTPEPPPVVAETPPSAPTESMVMETPPPAPAPVIEDVKPFAPVPPPMAHPQPNMSREFAGLLAKSQMMAAQKKYAEAFGALDEMNKLQLTEPQKKIVEDIRSHIEQMKNNDVAKPMDKLPPKP